MTYLGGKWRNGLFHVWDIATSYQLAAEDFRTAVGLRAPHLRTELVCDPEAHPAMGPGNWSHRLGAAAFGSCPGNLTCAYMYVSVQSLSHVRLFATPWIAARQAFLSSTNSWSLLKLMYMELAMPFNQVIFCHPLLLLPSSLPSIRVFSNESALHIRWPKYWSFSISPSNEYSGLISFRIDWFDLLAVQGTLKSLLQHHHSCLWVQKHQFFGAQLSLHFSPHIHTWLLEKP